MNTISTTTQSSVSFEQDWSRDGYLVIKGASTLERYKQIREEIYHAPVKECDCFFAFDNRQFADGLKSIRPLKDGEKVVRVGGGLFGTRDGVAKLFAWYDEKNKQIAAECNPLEVYLYECNNHEACYNPDGDEEAVALLIKYFGETVAQTVPRIRRYECYPFDEIAGRLRK